MIVGNWMQRPPAMVESDALVSEAKRLITENGHYALVVIDNSGKLRGLVTRANLLRLGHFVMRMEDPDEFKFFVNRLRVRDIMLRNPATIGVNDTIAECLRKGQELGVAQFPVLDGEDVVGLISAREIFQLAACSVGAWDSAHMLTLAPLRLSPGLFGKIAHAAEAAGAVPQALHGLSRRMEEGGGEIRTLTLQFHAPDPAAVVGALEAAGFAIVPCRAG